MAITTNPADTQLQGKTLEDRMKNWPQDLIAVHWAETLSEGEQSVLLTSSLRRLQQAINIALDRAAVAGPRGDFQRRLFEECRTANWDPNLKNSFAEEIAHLHEELSEAFRAWRRYKDCEVHEINGKPEGVPIEFADALIGMFYNAELHGFDLLAAIERKHQFNLERDYVAEGRQLHPPAATSSPAPAESDDDDVGDRAWERQSTINAIAYEFMRLFGVTAKHGKTHDEMRPLFDAAREIVTRTYPVLMDLCDADTIHTTAPPESTRVVGEQLAIQIVGTTFEDTAASHETLRQTVIQRITDWLSGTSSDSARLAAEEIREWIGISGLVDGKGVNGVAAIISKHLE